MRTLPRRLLAAATSAVALVALAAPMASADSSRAAAGFGQLYYDGHVVRTVVTPTSQPGRGVDTIYAFAPGAAQDQLAVTTVAPGEPGYHGGRWAVHVVTWNAGSTPTLLTSAADVAAAQATGQVSVTRVPQADFVCPVAGR